jgi:hypothetical protein
LSRDARNLKKLKAIRRAEFRLKQRLEYIDWEEDNLNLEIEEFMGQAKLPELPSEQIITVIHEDPKPRPKTRARRQDS